MRITDNTPKAPAHTTRSLGGLAVDEIFVFANDSEGPRSDRGPFVVKNVRFHGSPETRLYVSLADGGGVYETGSSGAARVWVLQCELRIVTAPPGFDITRMSVPLS